MSGRIRSSFKWRTFSEQPSCWRHKIFVQLFLDACLLRSAYSTWNLIWQCQNTKCISYVEVPSHFVLVWFALLAPYGILNGLPINSPYRITHGLPIDAPYGPFIMMHPAQSLMFSNVVAACGITHGLHAWCTVRNLQMAFKFVPPCGVVHGDWLIFPMLNGQWDNFKGLSDE